MNRYRRPRRSRRSYSFFDEALGFGLRLAVGIPLLIGALKLLGHHS